VSQCIHRYIPVGGRRSIGPNGLRHTRALTSFCVVKIQAAVLVPRSRTRHSARFGSRSWLREPFLACRSMRPFCCLSTFPRLTVRYAAGARAVDRRGKNTPYRTSSFTGGQFVSLLDIARTCHCQSWRRLPARQGVPETGPSSGEDQQADDGKVLPAEGE